MKTQQRTWTATDLDLGGNRTLRVGLERNEDGEPEHLHMALGWGEGRAWREEKGEGLTLPADTLPALRDALHALTDHPRAP
jgi:hypothetical protein